LKPWRYQISTNFGIDSSSNRESRIANHDYFCTPNVKTVFEA
jgi:hypothetical protein